MPGPRTSALLTWPDEDNRGCGDWFPRARRAVRPCVQSMPPVDRCPILPLWCGLGSGAPSCTCADRFVKARPAAAVQYRSPGGAADLKLFLKSLRFLIS